MDLVDVFRVMVKRWKLIAIVTLVFTALVAGVGLRLLPDIYCAKATLYVLNTQADVNDTYYELRAAQLIANDFAEIANSPDMRSVVAHSIGLNNIDDYDTHVEVAAGTRVINLLVNGPDAEMASKIASSLCDSIADSAVELMGVERVNFVGGVSAGTKPMCPQRKLLTAASFCIGFAFGTIYVVGAALLDTRVRSEQDIADLVPVPVFGHVAVVEKG